MGVKRGWEAHQCKIRTGSLDWKWDCVGVHIIERQGKWLMRRIEVRKRVRERETENGGGGGVLRIWLHELVHVVLHQIKGFHGSVYPLRIRLSVKVRA